MAQVLNNETFNDSIKDGVVLVDFYADWCGPCQVLAPVIESISEERNDIEIYKLNVDDSSDIASEYGVMSIPTVIIYKDGEEAERITGANDAAAYNARIDELLK